MKRLHFLSLAAMAALAAAPARGQETDAQLTYNAEKKGVWTAVALERFLPIVGHAYAGDAKRGIVPLAVTMGGVVMAGAGLVKNVVEARSDEESVLVFLGVGIATVGRLWGIVSAGELASDANRALRERLGLDAGLDFSLAPAVVPDGRARFRAAITVRH